MLSSSCKFVLIQCVINGLELTVACNFNNSLPDHSISRTFCFKCRIDFVFKQFVVWQKPDSEFNKIVNLVPA